MYKMGLKVAGATGETKLKVRSETKPYNILSLVNCKQLFWIECRYSEVSNVFGVGGLIFVISNGS
jgi:hypothetical protein